MAEEEREADAHAPKCWANGRTTSSNQKTLGYDVAAGRIVMVYQTKP